MTAPTTKPVVLTRHAVDRYQQRVRPELTFDQARADLQRLAAAGTISAEPPAWLGSPDHRQRLWYLTVGDIALPLARADRRLTAVTTIPAVRSHR